MPVVGFLHIGSPAGLTFVSSAFSRGLADAGYVDGRNVAIEYRWAEDQNAQLSTLAADLVRRKVSVIAAGATPAALAAKAATSTIPIVFAVGADPVQLGIVASLNRPGGNMTGVSFLSNVLVAKQWELLRELVPSATVIAVLANPTNPNVRESSMRAVQAAAGMRGLQMPILNVSSVRDIDAAFAKMVQLQASALIVPADAFFTSHRDRFVALAARHSISTIYFQREFIAAGGLMSYGTSLADAYHQVGVYTGRILKGDAPANLPVQQSVKVELVINLKTAKTLGLTVPMTLLGRADEIIE